MKVTNKYVNPDEREAIKAKIQQEGVTRIIDKVSVQLKAVDDKYRSTLHNINQNLVNIDEERVHVNSRLFKSGVWADITVRYDSSFDFKNLTRLFFIDRLKSNQLTNRAIETIQRTLYLIYPMPGEMDTAFTRIFRMGIQKDSG